VLNRPHGPLDRAPYYRMSSDAVKRRATSV